VLALARTQHGISCPFSSPLAHNKSPFAQHQTTLSPLFERTGCWQDNRKV
jgi:hypothetical protein